MQKSFECTGWLIERYCEGCTRTFSQHRHKQFVKGSISAAFTSAEQQKSTKPDQTA
jgi:hypothetical protein